jgi:hypothetical protein
MLIAILVGKAMRVQMQALNCFNQIIPSVDISAGKLLPCVLPYREMRA